MRALGSILLVCSAALTAEPKPYPLPADGNAVVMQLDYEGGFRAPRKDGAPRLTILAAGTVRIAVGEGILIAKMTPRELQALLRFAIAKHRIFDFDGSAVREQIRKSTGDNAPLVEDAADTVITIVLRKKKVTASFHALRYTAGRLADIQALQDLRAVEQRLEHTVHVVRAGGRRKVEDLLRAANAKLKRERAAEPPLGIDTLIRTHRWKNGGMDLLFERRTKGGTLRVNVHAPLSKAPWVSIEARRA